jgi:hypothetical protein
MDVLKTSRELAIDDTVIAIERADIKEAQAILMYREETDPELKESHKEDAYLQRLIQVRESRMLGKELFESEKIEAVLNCSYESLFIPEYEDYEIS